jgi:hypothetical protein
MFKKLALLLFPAMLNAQSLRQMTRSTSTTGLNDSALTLISDSAATTKAGSVAQLRKALATKSWDSLLVATRLIGTDSTWTIGKAAGLQRPKQIWVVDTVFAKKFCTGVGTCIGGVTYPLLASGGTVSAPDYSWASSTGLGFYRFGADTLGLATGGVQSLRISGGNSPKITGSASNNTNLSILAGSANSNSIIFLATSSTGVAGTKLSIKTANITPTVPIWSANGSAALPSIAFGNDSASGFYNFGAQDTIGISTGGVKSLDISSGASVKIRGGAGNMTIQCGTGVSRTCTFATTTSGSTATNALTINDVQQMVAQQDGSVSVPQWTFAANNGTGMFVTTSNGALGLGVGGSLAFWSDAAVDSMPVRVSTTGIVVATNGSAAAPSFTTQGSKTTGFYRFGVDTIGITTAGTSRYRMSAASIGVTSDNVRSLGDTAFRFTTAWLNPATEGSSQNALCITAGGQIQQNGTTTCLVSSARYKTDIKDLPLDRALNIVMGLKVKTYTEKMTGRKGINVIAEQADSVDHILAARDKKGIIQAVNEEMIVTSMLLILQKQETRLNKMCKSGIKEAC